MLATPCICGGSQVKDLLWLGSLPASPGRAQRTRTGTAVSPTHQCLGGVGGSSAVGITCQAGPPPPPPNPLDPPGHAVGVGDRTRTEPPPKGKICADFEEGGVLCKKKWDPWTGGGGGDTCATGVVDGYGQVTSNQTQPVSEGGSWSTGGMVTLIAWRSVQRDKRGGAAIQPLGYTLGYDFHTQQGVLPWEDIGRLLDTGC